MFQICSLQCMMGFELGHFHNRHLMGVMELVIKIEVSTDYGIQDLNMIVKVGRTL